jgi:hypothetical protein
LTPGSFLWPTEQVLRVSSSTAGMKSTQLFLNIFLFAKFFLKNTIFCGILLTRGINN